MKDKSVEKEDYWIEFYLLKYGNKAILRYRFIGIFKYCYIGIFRFKTSLFSSISQFNSGFFTVTKKAKSFRIPL
ncbi:MAG: hypothetical protein DCO96_10230 [Fluviicola sp. XM-24bin1]|nr:MAG: hypothetical protein DCO96_10230 [Fluviicola sp. XM-24bin1]